MDKLMAKLMAEGASSPEFTHEEKLALVADGAMAPEEVGLASAEEAKLQIEPEQKARPNFGNEVFLQAGVVPIELRAEWAYDEMKVQLAPKDKTAWIQDWIEKNQKTYRVQASVRSGNIQAKFERTFTDPVLGLAAMLVLAGQQMEAAYMGTNPEPNSDEADKALPQPETHKLEDKNESSKPKE